MSSKRETVYTQRLNKPRRTRKRIRIPWWKVPKHILIDVAEATGGVVDPTKMKWYFNVETEKMEAKE